MSPSNSHIQMGSLQHQDNSLVGTAPTDTKMASLDTPPNRTLVSASLNYLDLRSLLNCIFKSVKIVLLSDKINLLIPFGPLAILVHNVAHQQGWIFILSLLGIIPLAERLGWATEQLACYTGDTVGGLLNATFGNATELIISMYAMKNGMLRVIQQSLLGSILSNMLLVLGCAFFSGGIVHPNKEQVFNKGTALVNSGLLMMAVMGLLFPAVLHFTHTELHVGKSELALSRFSSCVMLIAYGAYLFFQLTSQSNMYSPISEEDSNQDVNLVDEETPRISKWESIIWLFVLTVWISALSEYLVNAIEIVRIYIKLKLSRGSIAKGASVALNMPVAFISVILLPIVGNAAEHAGAIMFAMKDKLDLSLGVAIGSSTQIAMFGIPFCVVIGWILGYPVDLNFQLFETATLFMAVIVVAFMLQEGTSNYFKGLMLLLCYLIVAASFFVHKDPQPVGNTMVWRFSSHVLPSDGIAAIGTSGVMLMLCMIVMTLSIISMIIFGCGDSGDSGGDGSPRHRRHHHAAHHHGTAHHHQHHHHHHHHGGGGSC